MWRAAPVEVESPFVCQMMAMQMMFEKASRSGQLSVGLTNFPEISEGAAVSPPGFFVALGQPGVTRHATTDLPLQPQKVRWATVAETFDGANRYLAKFGWM